MSVGVFAESDCELRGRSEGVAIEIASLFSLISFPPRFELASVYARDTRARATCVAKKSPSRWVLRLPGAQNPVGNSR